MAFGVGSMLQRLEYPTKGRTRIQQDYHNMQRGYPDLTPTDDVIYGSDGRREKLLKLQGTVPVRVGGLQQDYNINVWIPKGYPDDAPKLYVAPTVGMKIRPGHEVVGLDGMCRGAGAGWHRNHSLVAHIGKLCQVFQRDPPLYARHDPAAYPHPARSSRAVRIDSPALEASADPARFAAVPNPYARRAHSPPPLPDVLQPAACRPRLPATLPTPAPPRAAAPGGGGWKPDPRDRLRPRLLARLRDGCAGVLAEREQEVEHLLRRRDELLAERRAADAAARRAAHRRADAAAAAEEEAGLREWLRRAEPHAAEAAAALVTELDPLSAQVLELRAEDEACDDAAYVYDARLKDRARGHGVAAAEYVRVLRELYARQFRARALLKKVTAERAAADRFAEQRRGSA